MTCPPLSTVAAWVLGELDSNDEQAFEEHFFGCSTCETRALQVRRVLATLRASLPPILTESRRRALEQRHVRTVSVKPGERGRIRLGPSVPVGLWLMSADLTDTDRVDFEGTSPDGQVLFVFPDVPFDRERGEVALPCQEHYRHLQVSAEMHVRLTATSSSGTKRVTEYILDHVFESP